MFNSRWFFYPFLIVFLAGCGKGVKLDNQTFSAPASSTSSESVSISYTVTLPTLTADAYGTHDSSAFTVNFTNPDGATVTCSYDGGSTYTSCDSSTTMIFTPTHHSNGTILKIKFELSGETEIYSFDPATQYSSISFYSCDTTLTAAAFGALTFSTFQATHLATSDTVICLESGGTLTDSTGTDMTFGAGNITIIGSSSGSKPKFQNSSSATDAGIFDFSSYEGINLANLELESGTASSGRIVYLGTGGTGGDPKDNTIKNVTMTGNGSNVYGIYAATGVHNLTVSNVTITHTTNSSAIRIQGTSLSTITVSDSTFTVPSLSTAILVASGTMSISNSTITGGTTGAALGVWCTSAASTVSLTQVLLEARNYAVSFSAGASNCTVNMDQVAIKHLNSGSSQPAFYMGNAGSTTYINSTGSQQNVACNEDSGGVTFSEIIQTHANTNQGTYDASNSTEQNTNNSSINDCSTYTISAP